MSFEAPCHFCPYPVKSTDDIRPLTWDENGEPSIVAHRACWEHEEEIQLEREVVWGGRNVQGI